MMFFAVPRKRYCSQTVASCPDRGIAVRQLPHAQTEVLQSDSCLMPRHSQSPTRTTGSGVLSDFSCHMGRGHSRIREWVTSYICVMKTYRLFLKRCHGFLIGLSGLQFFNGLLACVEVFATGTESSDQGPSRMCSSNSTFDPYKIKQSIIKKG